MKKLTTLAIGAIVALGSASALACEYPSRVDIPDGNFCALTTLYVSVDDGSVCPAVASETEAVDKFTMVNATDAP